METYDVVIVGAGVSGISAGYHLRKQGFTVAILDAAPGVGGTWQHIQFPGIRSDSDMVSYSFTWYKWTRPDKLADAAEIKEYLDEAVAFAGISDAFHFNTRVKTTSYSSADHQWTITSDKGNVYRSQFLFMAAGYYEYDSAYTPEFPKIDQFQGRVVHPQQWAPSPSEWKDKRVVVIGSGATAATITPAMAKSGAKHVTMLQRSPGYWVAETKSANVFNPVSKVLGVTIAFHLTRVLYFFISWVLITLCTYKPDWVRTFIKKKMAPLLPEDFDADVHFNPRYDPWDERVCLIADGDFFTCLREGTVSVVTDTVDHFEERSIALTSGERIDDVDLVCTATGFNLHPSLPFPSNIEVLIDGKPYNPRSHFFYNSCMVSDVPNFIFTMGYFRYSWTIKADLVSAYAARLWGHMRDEKLLQVRVRRPADLQEVQPSDALKCGYLKRCLDKVTRYGPGIWTISQSPFTDMWRLRYAAFGKEMEFS